MTVVYDLLGTQSKEHGERGIARYVLNLALALEREAPDLVDIYLVRDDLPLPGVTEPLVRTGKVRTMKQISAAPPAHGVYIVASPYELGVDLENLLPTWARHEGWKRCGVVYDLIPMIFPDVYLTDLWAHRYRARTTTLSRFDHLFAISEASKNDAVRLLGVEPDAVTMIGAGADEQFAPPTRPIGEVVAELSERLPALRSGYLLFPSGIEWRKNLHRMLDAYSRLPEQLRADHQLVMVCRTNEVEQKMLDHETRALGIGHDFLATGFVDDADLVRLYQAASLVVFPSLYEGFGLPVLEARQCGAPVICSDSSSLKEVQPDRRARFDPYDVEEMATVLERTLGDESELARLKDAEIPPFTWDWGAERAAPEIRELDRRSFPIERRRLAVVTPLPPQRSGIATYAARILSSITDQVDLTILVDTDPNEIHAPAGVDVRTISQFSALERLDGAFDVVLYFMGNSHFHVEALELLRRRGGTVLMHDARMTGLYETHVELAPARLPGGTVGGFLRRWYPTNYRDYLYDLDVITASEADRFGILLTREIAEHADRILTHSAFAASMISLDSGADVEVAFPIPVHTLGDSRGDPGAEPPLVIATFGMVDPVKRPELLIQAAGMIKQVYPELTFRFVGEAEDYKQQALGALIAEAGLTECVEFTGSLSDEDYAEALAVTTIAVQLRAFTNGESSAAVADMIGTGVPVVVSRIGALAELPDDVVSFVPANATADQVASALLDLIADPKRRANMTERGLDYAHKHTYEAAGHQLLRMIMPTIDSDEN